MSLGAKMFWLFTLAFGVTSSATCIVSYLVITKNFERLEERIVAANLTRIANVVDHQSGHLYATANDYATWDSTYRFMGHRYRDYEETEISSDSFNRYGIHVFLLFRDTGGLALCREFGNGTPPLCSQRDELELLRSAVQRLHDGTADGRGLVVLNHGPMLIAMSPIVRTDGSGPSRGTLVVGRWLDEREVQNFAKILMLPMTAVVANSSNLHTAIAKENGAAIWMDHGDDSITGHVRIQSVLGGPGLVLSTEFHRDLLQQGRLAQRLLLGLLIILALVLNIVGFTAQRKFVLGRIGRLSSMAALVSSTQDLSQRVRVSGDDEITALENSFNAMLADLEEARKELLFAHQALEYHARHDGLTGVLNRTALMAGLSSELSRAAREGSETAVILMDLDYFKRVNDNYGHAVGDEILKAVMETVRHSVRQYDLVGRYGGEEFVLVAPGTGEADAIVLAERVRRNIEQLRTTPRVTVSIGVVVTQSSQPPEELLRAADAALYRAKAAGRNRVEFYGSFPQLPDPKLLNAAVVFHELGS